MKITVIEACEESKEAGAHLYWAKSKEAPGCFGAGDTKEEARLSFLEGVEALKELEEDDDG